MNYYICEECLYTFSSTSQPSACPDCGKAKVRNATSEEAQEKIDYENMLLKTC